MRHLLSTADLSRADALAVLDTAEEMAAVNQREVKKLPALRGRTVVNLFFEDSTRTRLSFEAAAKRLIAARSQRVIALVDSTKFGAEHLCTFADLSAIDVLITDAVPPSSLAEALNRAEIEVVIA